LLELAAMALQGSKYSCVKVSSVMPVVTAAQDGVMHNVFHTWQFLQVSRPLSRNVEQQQFPPDPRARGRLLAREHEQLLHQCFYIRSAAHNA
jgi:hypothetical protein